MTYREKCYKKLDQLLEQYRACQELIQEQQDAIMFLHKHKGFEPGIPGGLDINADDLLELLNLSEATVDLNKRWIAFGECRLRLDVKPKPKDRSHLKVIN